jgi:lauroyl/myristoyl acyltransferase
MGYPASSVACDMPEPLLRRPPWIQFRDVGLLLMLLAIWPAAWCLPERAWPGLSRVIARVLLFLRFRQCQRHIAGIERVLRRAGLPHTASEVYLAHRAGLVEQHFQYWAEIRPGGWHPRLTLVGDEHLRAARTAGRGAILWIGPFLYSFLLTKKALKQAGYDIAHLSRPDHGPSKTRFGMAVLNGIRPRAEAPYLAERLVMRPGDEIRATRRLQQILQGGGLVSITLLEGAHKSLTPTVLGAPVAISGGPVNLAMITGAALLPVMVRRTGLRDFEVWIEPALSIRTDIAPEQAVQQAVDDMARRLERWTVQEPAQARLWHELAVFGRTREVPS